MIIEIPYDVGDKIWIASCFSYFREVSCLLCKQTGQITLQSGKKSLCGICRGTGTHIVNRPYKFRPVYTEIVGIKYQKDKQKCTVDYNCKNLRYSCSGADLIKTFRQARKLAVILNKRYGWPKENYNVDPIFEVTRSYWGYRTAK